MVASTSYFLCSELLTWMAGHVPLRLMMPFVTTVSLVSFKVLNKTKHIPSLAKFLASGLILFDSIAITSLLLKEYIPYTSTANAIFQILGITAAFLSYFTVPMMCFERYMAIARPYLYIRYSQHGPKLAVVAWLSYVTFHYGLPIFSCKDIQEDEERTTCYSSSILLGCVVIFSITFSVSVPSLVVIMLVIKRQAQRTCVHKKRVILKGYRSTLAVVVCLLSVTIVGTGYLLIQLLLTKGTDDPLRRLLFDYLAMLNCVIDSCAYVFWYRECRMTALRMVQCIHPALKCKVEDMRIKVFNINVVQPIKRPV